MKVSEFRMLNIEQQVMVFAGAIRVGRCEQGGCITECRQIDDFYVECEIQTNNNFKCLLYCHRNTDRLDKYFEDLPPLNVGDLLRH